MEDKNVELPVARIKSPSRNARLRLGRGFSLIEVEKAGKSVQLLKKLKIRIDYKRQSSHDWNVEELKKIKLPIEKNKKKKKPYSPKVKEIKREKFKGDKKRKPKVEKVKVKEKEKEIKPEVKKKLEVKKEKVPKKKVSKKKEPAEEKPEPEVKEEGIPLTALPGLGLTTAKKFQEMGVEDIEGLLQEDAAELAALIKGCTEVRIKTWMMQGKDLLEEK